MNARSRLLAAAASLLLIGMFFLPIWRIDLTAPQYPEGLGMEIRINTIQGLTEYDLERINNLNHYIGMKAIEPEAIPELAIMPWLVGSVIVGGLIVAALGSRPVLLAWAGAFAGVAVIGLADFWRWTYDYGHNLDFANAIIKVPGMSYQPPLIGTKQLLNFTASSWPAAGGWFAFAAMALAIAAVVFAWRTGRVRSGATLTAVTSVA
jgi:copper chaperone NosL